MSGRSAYVRKKITEPKTGDKGALTVRGRSKSASVHNTVDDGSVYDYPMPQGTGFGTTNARLLKFSDPTYEGDVGHYRSELANLSNNSGGSQSGSSENERREVGWQAPGPMPDYAYARARKPVLKTEDVSGIERSGFRSAVDKKSDGIRKGITRAFKLGLKKKKDVQLPDRAPSSATLRPQYYDADNYGTNEIPSLPTHKSSGALPDPHYEVSIPSPPLTKLPPVPSSTAPPIKRWIGAGRPVQRWNKLRKDPELWDPNGDVLVYFGRKDQPQRPNPSFRLSSHIIEATESRFLVTLLREGSTEDDYSHINLPPSPLGAPPMLRHNSYTHIGQTTPPISEENAHADIDGQISYEMYFPTPPNLNKAESHRHAITTRNVFALLYHASLVGISLFQALQDLLGRLDAYMEPDADNVGTILNYLSARGIDDARNDPETAVSMLAWSETPEVRWEEGWREAFLHCAGMYARLENCADFRHLTPITRALLERACLETQLRVQAAEERLVAFAFADAWGPTPASNTARAAAERLQQFFISHYAKTCGTWPPAESGARTTDGEEMWLTRTVAQMLQKDFGALYDYLVNRDVVWDESEMRSSRKWMMVSESGNKSFEADTEDLPLTDLLIEFDNRMRFPHIPHPYPLVPDSIPAAPSPRPGSSRDRSKKDKDKDKNAKSVSPDDRTLERRIQLAYTEATNIYSLGSEFAQSDLIESFVKFEKTDMVGSVDPFTARRGRWVLIYTVLQILATISVDSPNVRYKDGVPYHLSPRLKGTRTPPWKGVSSPAIEASHELSHCWVAPTTWNAAADNSAAESDTSIGGSGGDNGGTDFMIRMMRSNRGAHHHNNKFPRPPPPSSSSRTTSRSGFSHAGGWQTPSSNTVRSSSTTATPTTTMWGGGSSSVSNYSDDTTTTSFSNNINNNNNGGRILLPSTQYNNHIAGYMNKCLPRPPPPPGGPPAAVAVARSSLAARSDRSNATFGTGTNAIANANLNSSYNSNPNPTPSTPGGGGGEGPPWPARTQSMYRTQPPAPLDLLSIGGVTGKGDFFADMPYTPTSNSGKGGGGDGTQSSPEALGPVIRDFDELDSVVEETGFENRI